MYEQAKGRSFKIWEYHVSHGSLLIRSPAFGDLTTNIDFIFSGVSYISGPTILEKINLVDPNETDVARVVRALHNPVRMPAIWKFETDFEVLLIAGAFMNFKEHDLGIFSTPFDWRVRA